jgi:ABC-type multidrug transport system ATPase subunit
MLRVEGLVTAGLASPLTFDVPNGRILGLLSADRDVLLRIAECVVGIRSPTSGRATIGDADTRSESARSSIAINLPRASHALTTLGEHLETIGRARRVLRVRPKDAAARLGLSYRLRLNNPSAKAAAALLAALLPESSLIVLHDPFCDVEEQVRTGAVEWIRSLAATPVSMLVTGTAERDVRAISHTVSDVGAVR